MKLTRDGALPWVLAGAALVGYLVTTKVPPTQWDYMMWLNFVAWGFGWLAGKLGTSPAPSSGEVARGFRDDGRPIVSILLVLGLSGALLASGCSLKQRHIATVSVVSAHAVLSAVQDTERALVCGTATAPAPPACVPTDVHRTISGHLVTAFDLDGQVARLVRATPAGGLLPADVPRLIGEISALVVRIMAIIPSSPQKANLQLKIGAGS